jgi:hypothetical protein
MELEPIGSRILIMNSVRLAAQWRGFGVGVLLAGTAIKKVSRGFVPLSATRPDRRAPGSVRSSSASTSRLTYGLRFRPRAVGPCADAKSNASTSLTGDGGQSTKVSPGSPAADSDP